MSSTTRMVRVGAGRCVPRGRRASAPAPGGLRHLSRPRRVVPPSGGVAGADGGALASGPVEHCRRVALPPGQGARPAGPTFEAALRAAAPALALGAVGVSPCGCGGRHSHRCHRPSPECKGRSQTSGGARTPSRRREAGRFGRRPAGFGARRARRRGRGTRAETT